MASKFDVVSRISALLDNKDFSDVEFIVKDSANGHKRIYAHKLILATASKFFARALFTSTEKFSRKRVNTPDSTSAPALYAMLQYLYTDKLQPSSRKEAFEIYKLSKDYEIESLSHKCTEYLLEESIDSDNVLEMYECALKENIPDVIDTCRKFVRRESRLILESIHFSHACDVVVLDILKQDTLNVNSEMQVIDAVLKWCFYECKRKNLPVEETCLRTKLTPFLKYLRFLSLSADEYCDFSERNNIFTSHESTMLMRKILQPGDQITLPENLCTVSHKRNSCLASKPTGNEVAKSGYASTTFMQFPKQKSFNDETDSRNTSQKHLTHEERILKTSKKDFVRSDVQSYNIKPQIKSMDTDLFSCPAKTLLDDRNSSHPIPFSYLTKNPTDVSSSALDTPLSYTIKPFLNIHPESIAPGLNKASEIDNVPKVSQEFLSSPVNIRSFSIPLEEAKKEIGSAFVNDIKCNVVLKMLKGSIFIHSLELTIKKARKTPDILEVFLCLTGFTPRPIENVYEHELKTNNIEIKFPNPVKLEQNNKGEIEITVESLRLERCNICRFDNQTQELINGLDAKSEILLSSNRIITKENFFFLISKINYSLC